jgi:hypothetical protein
MKRNIAFIWSTVFFFIAFGALYEFAIALSEGWTGRVPQWPFQFLLSWAFISLTGFYGAVILANIARHG